MPTLIIVNNNVLGLGYHIEKNIQQDNFISKHWIWELVQSTNTEISTLINTPTVTIDYGCLFNLMNIMVFDSFHSLTLQNLQNIYM